MDVVLDTPIDYPSSSAQAQSCFARQTSARMLLRCSRRSLMLDWMHVCGANFNVCVGMPCSVLTQQCRRCHRGRPRGSPTAFNRRKCAPVVVVFTPSATTSHAAFDIATLLDTALYAPPGAPGDGRVYLHSLHSLSTAHFPANCVDVAVDWRASLKSACRGFHDARTDGSFDPVVWYLVQIDK